MSKKEDDTFKFIQLLSQRWSSQDKRIKDYSCNEFADKISLIDFFLSIIPKEHKFRKLLEQIRVMLILRGQAIWIRDRADILTQLGIKVGKTYKTISMDEKEGMEE